MIKAVVVSIDSFAATVDSLRVDLAVELTSKVVSFSVVDTLVDSIDELDTRVLMVVDSVPILKLVESVVVVVVIMIELYIGCARFINGAVELTN